jgi:hypothetical protein
MLIPADSARIPKRDRHGAWPRRRQSSARRRREVLWTPWDAARWALSTALCVILSHAKANSTCEIERKLPSHLSTPIAKQRESGTTSVHSPPPLPCVASAPWFCDTRAEADPLFTRAQVAALVHSYLGDADPAAPLASPLYGQFAGMAPIRVHVGDDELLLDDSRRYVQYAKDAGVDARLDVWMGMFHGFPGSVGKLKAAGQALDDVGAFLADRMRA